MSRGRKPSRKSNSPPPGMSTRSRHFQLAVHDHVRERQHGGGAAHVLLHDEHAGVGLDVEPAGIEADALADQRDFRMLGIAPAQIDQPRCARRGAADRMDQREILFQRDRRRSRSSTLAPCRFASARAASSSSAGPMSFDGVLIEIARERHGFGDAGQIRAVDAVRHGEADIALVLDFAIAREPISAEREGERGEPRVVRRIGETIDAGRQETGEAARQERIARAVADFPGRTARRQARRWLRQREMAPGLGLESRWPRQRRAGRIELACGCRSSSPPSRTRSGWRWMRRACLPVRRSDAWGLTCSRSCLDLSERSWANFPNTAPPWQRNRRLTTR